MITFRLDTKEVERALGGLINGLSDFKPALKQVRGFQVKEIEGQFASEGSKILGGKWQRLARSTIESRLRAGFGAGPILTASGKMRKSFKQKKLNKNELAIGSDVKYFKFHQLGTSKTPRRQVLGHSDRMQKEVLDIISNYLIKKAKS